MIVALFALSAAMMIGGIASVIQGFPFVRLESGLAMTIAGAGVASAGAVLFGLGVIASRLKRIEGALGFRRLAGEVRPAPLPTPLPATVGEAVLVPPSVKVDPPPAVVPPTVVPPPIVPAASAGPGLAAAGLTGAGLGGPRIGREPAFDGTPFGASAPGGPPRLTDGDGDDHFTGRDKEDAGKDHTDKGRESEGHAVAEVAAPKPADREAPEADPEMPIPVPVPVPVPTAHPDKAIALPAPPAGLETFRERRRVPEPEPAPAAEDDLFASPEPAPAKDVPHDPSPAEEEAFALRPSLSTEAAPPSGPTPEKAPGPTAGSTSEREVVGTYASGGNTYVMYSNGAIQADTPRGRFDFGSLDELKAFVDAGGETSRGAA